MMSLNLNNGSFQFGKWLFRAKEHLTNLKSKFSSNEIELWVGNDEWVTYRLNISDQYIFIVKCFNEITYSIEIYPKNLSGNEHKNILNKILKDIGGENKYTWGNVELNVDNKAGYESILINYYL